MDRAITASDANQHFSEMLREVARGERYTITSRGRPVARIVPVETGERRAAVAGLLAYLGSLPIRYSGDWSRADLYE